MTLSTLKGVVGDEIPLVLCRDKGGRQRGLDRGRRCRRLKSGSESVLTLRRAQESALVPISALSCFICRHLSFIKANCRKKNSAEYLDFLVWILGKEEGTVHP